MIRFLVFLAAYSVTYAQGLDLKVLREIDALIEKGISDKRMPGGVLHLEHGEGIDQKSYGQRQLEPVVEGGDEGDHLRSRVIDQSGGDDSFGHEIDRARED